MDILKVILVFSLICILSFAVFFVIPSGFFKNFSFKWHYYAYSFSGTPEKMDALNKESIDTSRTTGKPITIVIHGAETTYYKDVYGTVVWFKENGVNVVSFDYDFKAAPDVSARKLSDFVDETLKETGTRKVNIMGTCLGGILAKYYAENFGGAEHIDKLITVISPARPIPETAIAYQYDTLFSFDPASWNQVLAGLQDKNPVKDHMYFYCKNDITVPAKYQFSSVGNFIGLECEHSFNNVNPEVLEPALDFINTH
ncbi:MAG: alpha/beta fold hydrolase [Candidatus Moraniibacteriota bacterium]